MLIPGLIGLAVLSGALHIWAEMCCKQRFVFLSKPLTMIFIILLAMQGEASVPFYKTMILGGLAFSLVGDILLMLPIDHFLAGLVAFLIAHLFYSVAFGSEIESLAGWPILPLALAGVVEFRLLSPGLGRMKLPVVFYMLAILGMAWLAWERALQGTTAGAQMAFVGALCFILSDSVLAINRFRGKFKYAPVLKLGAYYTAQLLIAGSLGALVG